MLCNMDTQYKKRGRKPKNINNETFKSNENNIYITSNIFDITDDDTLTEIDNVNNNDNVLWIEKYKPKNRIDFIGNKQEINKLYNWLNTFYDKSNNMSSAIIIGGHGVGKTSIINILLKETGYDIKNIYSNDLKNKDINDGFQLSFTNQIINKKYALVINNLENITIKSEKNNLIQIYKSNKENKLFPLILISNLQHSKIIENFKQKSLTIELINPTMYQLRNFVKDIAYKESMIFEDNDIIDKIIHFSQFDIRKLLYILQDLYFTFDVKKITNENFKQYQHNSQKKNIDIGLVPSSKELLDHYKGINYCMQLYESDKVLLPLMIYENYYRRLFSQKNIEDNKILELMSKIINSISYGDVIETNIYADQNWSLQDIHGFYTCVNTSFMINEFSSQIKNYNINFIEDLNKTSSKKINKKKNIQPLQSKLNDKNLEEILYINNIIFDLKLKKSPELKKLQEIYNLSKKDIENTLKIDKTTSKFISKKSILS